MKHVYTVKAYRHNGYSWVVESTVTGRRQRRFFRSLREAKTWAELRNIEYANSGLNALSVSDEMRVDVQRALLMLEPYGKTLLDAVAAALPVFEAQRSSKTVGEAVTELLEVKQAEGASKRYREDLRNQLARFVRDFGERHLSLIGTAEIKGWLRKLPVGAVSKNNMRRLLSVLWSFAVEAEWCEDNIPRKIKGFAVAAGRIGILKPEEAARLLHAAPKDVKPYLAVGLFAGLRRSELLRVSWDSIRLDAGLVEVRVTKTRGAARRFVKLRPNLREWMLAHEEFRPITPYQFRRGLEAAIEGAQLDRWPSNAMRHSFCSYALAHEKNLNELTLEMGHTNAQTLFRHYRELCTPQEAATYWQIAPI